MDRLDRRLRSAFKRWLDIAAAVFGLVVLSPVLALVAALLLITQGRPILFRQRRPGLHGEPFTIAKFRTMRAPHDGEIAHATDDERVTRLGRFLRTSSIDELPELWNVLRGDMSLVGPRPLLMEYLVAYTPRQRRRHDMRPGVTSLAAVSGRHTLPFEDRIELDLWYVEHWSLRLDVSVLLRTARQVLAREHVTTTQDAAAIGFPLPAAPTSPDTGSRTDG